MERVARQVQLTQQVLGTAGSEWGDISSALDELAHAIETLGLQESMRDVARLLLPISNELGAQITGFRSKLVGEVCRHMQRIVKVMTRDFRELANELLPSLVNSAKGASGAVRKPGAELFTVISEHVRFDLRFFGKIFAQSPQEKTRVLMLEQLAVILACWTKAEIEPFYSDVVEIVRRGLPDPAKAVRSATRDILCSFSALWEERVAELVDIPSGPARDALLKDKPRAVISVAILEKYPELQRKADKAEASSKTIAKRRSLYQKSSSIGSQDVEIHVATPPGKTRSDHDTRVKQTDTLSIPRRLFHDDESGKANPAANESGVPRRTPSKMDALHSDASATDPHTLSTGIPVPPASSRPEDIFRRSRIELKAEGSKIPPPPTRSPIPRSTITSRTSRISRSHESPPLESRTSPSRIPKPVGSTSLSMINFKQLARSPPKDDAGQENLSGASNVRDRFLDSPIPSSGSTPPPVRFDSNITVRARRRITAASSEDNAVLARDPIPVPLSAAVAPDSQPPHKEKPVTLDARVSATNPPAVQPPHEAQQPIVPVAPAFPIDVRASMQTQLPNEDTSERLQEEEEEEEEEPLPPTIALGSAVFEHESPPSPEQVILAEEEKAPVPVTFSAPQRVPDNASAGHAATSHDTGIEETMPISRKVVTRDYVETVQDTRERVRREEHAPDSLTKDALANLRGIQKKMAKLQALSKVDARGLPLKQRVGNFAESPSGRRPLNAGLFPLVPDEQPLRSPSRDKLESNSSAPRRKAGDSSDFSYEVRDSDSTHGFFETNEALESDSVENRGFDRRNGDLDSRDFKPPPVNRRVSHSQQSSGQFDSRQTNYPAQRSRARNQADASKTCEQVEVERHFQEIVRGAQGSSSRPSSAERNVTSAGIPAASEQQAQSSYDSSSLRVSFPAAENGVRNSMEPPLQWSVKPAVAPRSRHSVAEQPDSASRADGSRSQAEGNAIRRSSTVARDSRDSQPSAERKTKLWWGYAYTGYFFMLLGFLFGASGLLRAATTVRDTHDYHQALKMRIGMFEASISESYSSVRKLEENYAVWSEYVRMLAEEDETHALSLLETIQHEVEKWQVDMKHDLTQFKKSLSVDVVEAALAPLLQNSTAKSDP